MSGIPPEDVPRALNQRPLWQRAAVILAGPMANFLLAVVLFAGAQWNGIEEVAPVFSGPPAGSLLAEAGVRSGDRVVAVSQDGDDADDWDEVNSFDDVYEAIAVAMMDQRPLQLQVRGPADSGAHTLSLPLDSLGKTELDADAVVRIGLTAPFARPVLGRLLPEGPASRAGLHTGDLVLSVDGREIDDAQQLRDRIRASAADGQARTLRLRVARDGRVLDIPVTPRVMSDKGGRFGRIDADVGRPALELVRDDPLSALRYGLVQTGRRAVLNVRLFVNMLTGRVSAKNLSGPITIADAASESVSRGLSDFLAFLAQVSVGLGVLNLLPVPVLDGGRLLYYLFEGATGRPVSALWQARLQYGGILAILLLMSLALSNDVARLLGLQ